MQGWWYIKWFLLFLLVENLVLLGLIFRTHLLHNIVEMVSRSELNVHHYEPLTEGPTLVYLQEAPSKELNQTISSQPVGTSNESSPSQSPGGHGVESVSGGGGLSHTVGLPAVCEVPLSGFRSWNDGVVTTLKPVISRNCSRLFDNSPHDINLTLASNLDWNNSLSDSDILHMTSNCSQVVQYFANNLYVTKLERSFPVAYSFVIHDSPQQVLRLLRYLYRPTNYYCIHPDKKSPPAFLRMFKNLATCLDNVIIPAKLEHVERGKPSFMEAQMTCLEDLVRLRSELSEDNKWHYVINLCGKELPLTTTHEIASRLSRLNGQSAVGAWRVLRTTKPGALTWQRLLGHTSIPYHLPLYKSLAYMAISYDFAHFLLTNQTAIHLRQFFRRTHMAEEVFYATAYMIPGVPGGYDPKSPIQAKFNITQTIWHRSPKYRVYSCYSKFIHYICIVTCGDLSTIMKYYRDTGEKALFHNKYFMELDHTVMDCIEERAVAKNRQEFETDCSQLGFHLYSFV